jgi:serine/threonine-protein kinase
VQEIGHGAFGSIYSAVDPRTGGLVAVKVMRNDFSNPDDRAMFEREVTIIAGVDHHTMLGFRGWVPLSAASGDPPAILTEFMSRGSLQAVLKAEMAHTAPPEWTATRKWIALYGTAVGMMILHANRIIHRDLKPDNVLLNDQFEPKVADFGLSNLIDAASKQPATEGTIPFMAPEIHAGSACAFPGDVYAFGMLVYVAMSGQAPFTGLNAYALTMKVCQGDRPQLPESLGGGWKQLIQACWNHAPEKRPTFEQIVRGMAMPNFIEPGVDKKAILAYQQKVVIPELYLKK